MAGWRRRYSRCRRRSAAELTTSVMRATIGLSSFQHCQYSGTSRRTAEIRTNEPSVRCGAARVRHGCPGTCPTPTQRAPRHRSPPPSGRNAAVSRCCGETPCAPTCPATHRRDSTPTRGIRRGVRRETVRQITLHARLARHRDVVHHAPTAAPDSPAPDAVR